MERTAISIRVASAEPTITSQATRPGGFDFIAGDMPLDSASRSLPPSHIGPESHHAIRNPQLLFAADGSSPDRLVHATVDLRHWADFVTMYAVDGRYLTLPCRALACVEVNHIGDDATPEIAATANPRGEASGDEPHARSARPIPPGPLASPAAWRWK